MTISIRNPEAESLARELAQASGKNITDVVLEALRGYREHQHEQQGRQSPLSKRLLAIGAHCARLPDLDARNADEIMGYDERGLPA